MGRTVSEVIDALPAHRRRRIHARYRELNDELESLSELRKAVGKAQADIAASLKIRQPSVAKIEKQTDMYLSTLRGYVEALGGELELVVRLPTHWAMRLHQLGEVSSRSIKHAQRSRVRRSTSTRKSSKGLARTG
jgi:hypothetical protein